MTTQASGARFSRLWKSPWLRVARLLLVVLPLVWLVRRLDFKAIGAGIEHVGVARLTLGLFVQFLISVVVSLRWRILLASYGAVRVPSWLYLLRANYVANYFSLLPVPVADESVRVTRTLSAFAPGGASPWLVLLAERITGLVGLMLLPVTASCFGSAALDSTSLQALAIGSGVAFVLALPALALPSLLMRRPHLRTLVARLPLLGGTLSRLEPPARPFDVARAVLLSMLGHFGQCVVASMLFAPLDAAATLALCVRIQPIVILAMALPLTPGGIGQRELASATLYGLAGVAPTSAVTVAFLVFVLGLAQAAVGGVVYALERVFAHRRDKRHSLTTETGER